MDLTDLEPFYDATNVRIVGAPDAIRHYTPVAVEHGWTVEVDESCKPGVAYLLCDPRPGSKWWPNPEVHSPHEARQQDLLGDEERLSPTQATLFAYPETDP